MWTLFKDEPIIYCRHFIAYSNDNVRGRLTLTSIDVCRQDSMRLEGEFLGQGEGRPEEAFVLEGRP